MFKRTRYQFGSIERKERRKGADVWVLRYRETQADGSRKQRSILIGSLERFPTEASACKAAEVLRLSANPDDPTHTRVSFGALIDRYLSDELPERYSTARAYTSYLKNYIRPKWAEYAISEVKPFAVEEWLKTLSLAPKSKAHIKNIMRVLFNAAMRWELVDIGDNPMRLVRVKDATKRKEEPRVLSIEEFQKLLAEIPKEPFRTMVLVAMSLGLRVSEVAALRWSDVNFDQLELTVERGIVSGRVGEVKTKYSRGRMPLDASLACVLVNWRRTSQFNAATDWVFAYPGAGGRLPYYAWNVQTLYIRPAAKKAGLGEGIGWHTFRHTYSTMLRQLGVDLKVQQELLRHADIRTTMNVYTQAMPDDLRKANSRIVQMVMPGNPLAREATTVSFVA
jgi:integrase